jgi:PAS domain S-box-containing protein
MWSDAQTATGWSVPHGGWEDQEEHVPDRKEMHHDDHRQLIGAHIQAAHRKAGSFGNTTTVLLGSVGTDGKFKFLNPAWEKTLGYGSEELRTLPLRELVPLEVLDAIAVVKRFLDAVNLGPMEIGLRCKDGTKKRFLWHRRFDPELQRMFIAGEEIEGRVLEE